MPEENNILRRQIENVAFRAIDKEKRTVEFVASTNAVDSYGTVIPVDGWDLHRFEKNGVIGYQHNIYSGSDPDNVIGKGVAFIEDDALIVRVEFEPEDLNPKAEKIFRKIQFGSIGAVSVGFIPNAPGHWGRKADGEDPDVYYYNGQELLEVSVVNVPANPDAVKRSIEAERAGHEAERHEEEKKPESSGDINIRLTIAKAKRLLAKKNI